MSEESDLKRELVRQCKARDWYARRIEDQYAVGVLDVVVVAPWFLTMFIEAKVTDGMKFSPTERQFIEGQRIIAVKGGAIPLLVGWRRKVMYIADWAREAYITKSFAQPDGANYAQTIEEWIRWQKIKMVQSKS